MADPRGRFVWYELMTTDTGAAGDFYSKVIGWTHGPMESAPPGMDYTVFKQGEIMAAGMMTLPEEAKAQGAPPHWLAYIWAPEVDTAVSQAKDLGANVLVPPQDIPGIGRFTVLCDPHGAVFAVFSSGEPPTEEKQPGVGEFSWHELCTTDYEAGFKFYHSLFGWDKMDSMDMGGGAMYQMYGRNGRHLGGMYNKSSDMPAPPHWLLYVSVADIHKAVDAVKANGGQVLKGPMEVPGGDRVAQCMDPQGAAFALHAVAKG